MKTPATILVPIDETLRYLLYGVSVLLNIELRASEIERLFAEADADKITQKEYEFHRSPRVVVSGRVDEYEPETVWLSVEARRFDQIALQRLVDKAKHASFGLSTNRRLM